jgi:hypothetical protein
MLTVISVCLMQVSVEAYGGSDSANELAYLNPELEGRLSNCKARRTKSVKTA